jgi:hypothetical protein
MPASLTGLTLTYNMPRAITNELLAIAGRRSPAPGSGGEPKVAFSDEE